MTLLAALTGPTWRTSRNGCKLFHGSIAKWFLRQRTPPACSRPLTLVQWIIKDFTGERIG
jgi:hypothetical protein